MLILACGAADQHLSPTFRQNAFALMRTSLPRATTSPAVARRFVDDALRARAAAPQSDVAQLLVTELVTNAVLHARTDVEVVVDVADTHVWVGVSDRSAAAPVRPHYSDEAATGRGLLLVEALAARWGTDAHGLGKTVWFELDR